MEYSQFRSFRVLGSLVLGEERNLEWRLKILRLLLYFVEKEQAGFWHTYTDS